MARIRFNGEELANPPADSYWAPGEERDIDDDENVERLLRNPVFTQVATTRRSAHDQPPEQDQDQDQARGAHAEKDHASDKRAAHGR